MMKLSSHLILSKSEKTIKNLPLSIEDEIHTSNTWEIFFSNQQTLMHNILKSQTSMNDKSSLFCANESDYVLHKLIEPKFSCKRTCTAFEGDLAIRDHFRFTYSQPEKCVFVSSQARMNKKPEMTRKNKNKRQKTKFANQDQILAHSGDLNDLNHWNISCRISQVSQCLEDPDQMDFKLKNESELKE